MVDLIEKHRDELVALCRKYGLKRLDVFGSAVRGDFDVEKSDVDFIYEFDKDDPGDLWDRYWGFIEDSEKLLGSKVDMVHLPRVGNRFLIKSINESREAFYAA